MTAYRYIITLHLDGTVEADSPVDAELAALDDARETLEYNREWWAIAGMEIEAVHPQTTEAT